MAPNGRASKVQAGPLPMSMVKSPAIAHVNGLVLVTLNAGEFPRFSDLELEDWSKRRGRR
jgi:hypothetical protein